MRKFILLFIISVVSILPFKVSAVELEKSFETNIDFSDSSKFDLVLSYDDDGNIDGHIIYFYPDYTNNILRVVKYNLRNELVYDKSDSDINANDLDVSVRNDKLLLKRTNTDTQEIIWEKEYANNGKFSLDYKYYSYDNQGNIDGYLIMISNDMVTSKLEPGYYIMKYDLNGNLLWNKKNIVYQDDYLQDGNRDWFRFEINSEHGIFAYQLYNLTQDVYASIISAGNGWLPTLLKNEKNGSDLILIYRNAPENTLTFSKYNFNGEKITSKKLDIESKHWFRGAVNSKNVYGEYDGIIVGETLFDYTASSIIKFDYDGNVLWQIDSSYILYSIIENYDENGNFNGYLLTGSGNDGKNVFLTKFTYPKRVVVSKNDDVEISNDVFPGKVVTLTPKEKEGYIVKRVIVRDSSGKEIEVSSVNTFVMPDDDVSIEVIYEKRETIINPDTASTISIILVLIAITIIGTVAARSHNYLER